MPQTPDETPPDETPADERERTADERRDDASRSIGRTAAWSLGMLAFGLAVLLAGLPALEAIGRPGPRPAPVALAINVAGFAGLACPFLAFGAAVAAASTAALHWSLLTWPRRALGLVPLLALAGAVMVLVSGR